MTLQQWLTSLLMLPAVLILSTPTPPTADGNPFQLALDCHTAHVPQSSYTHASLLP
jgi:hypothetical protein